MSGDTGVRLDLGIMKASPIRCLVTAGPTREYIDPVRFISNPSSGKMGYALAEAAVDRGWEVDLVSGPVALARPKKAKLHLIETAEQMRTSLSQLFQNCDLLLMVAAVSDFRPKRQLTHKEKKRAACRTLELEPTPDLLLELGRKKGERMVVGFAAETENLLKNGLIKLNEKNLDWIAINRVGLPGVGFGSDSNQITLIGAQGERHSLGPGCKSDLAKEFLDVLKIEAHLNCCSV
tara:strand:- start:3404 stop:4108 length:705 start_codon:yes stop_codon:yes gene_type:complete